MFIDELLIHILGKYGREGVAWLKVNYGLWQMI